MTSHRAHSTPRQGQERLHALCSGPEQGWPLCLPDPFTTPGGRAEGTAHPTHPHSEGAAGTACSGPDAGRTDMFTCAEHSRTQSKGLQPSHTCSHTPTPATEMMAKALQNHWPHTGKIVYVNLNFIKYERNAPSGESKNLLPWRVVPSLQTKS